MAVTKRKLADTTSGAIVEDLLLISARSGGLELRFEACATHALAAMADALIKEFHLERDHLWHFTLAMDDDNDCPAFFAEQRKTGTLQVPILIFLPMCWAMPDAHAAYAVLCILPCPVHDPDMRHDAVRTSAWSQGRPSASFTTTDVRRRWFCMDSAICPVCCASRC
eukprot:3542373-Rhodomonas_salina.1